MDKITRIALGTVQFGLDYGINNSTGQVSVKEIKKILKSSLELGIKTLDTAYAYGDCEIRLGKVGVRDFNIVSKLPSCGVEKVEKYFKKSIERLKVNSLYGYLLHDFSSYLKDKNVWHVLKKLKHDGHIKKIGISLYSPEDLEKLWIDNIELDLVQIPYNVFDQRFQPYFKEMKKKGIEIHSRSTFLQGLFFKDVSDLDPFFDEVKMNLQLLKKFSEKFKLPIEQVCLGWVLENSYIDKVVIGVDSLEQFARNIEGQKKISANIPWKDLNPLQLNSLKIINPTNWKV